MDDVLRALADPTRRRILQLAWSQEIAAGELATAFEMSRPGVSQHLKVLRDAGLMRVRREGTRRLYRAEPQRLADLRDFLESFWTEKLDRLKFAAERQARRRERGA